MADRKKERQGRKPPASKPKAEARVAARKATAGSAKKADRKPKEAARKRPAMGLGPGAVGSPAQQVGMRAEAAPDRVAGDAPQVSGISDGAIEWQSEMSNRVTIPADNVARLLEQISAAVDTLGDSQRPLVIIEPQPVPRRLTTSRCSFAWARRQCT